MTNAFDWRARVGTATKEFQRSEIGRRNANGAKPSLDKRTFHVYSKAGDVRTKAK